MSENVKGKIMKTLSRKETSVWCSQHEIALSDFGLPKRSDASTRFQIPEDAQKRVYLVSQSMRAFSTASLLLVWIADWTVWPSGQRMHIFDRFRMSYGETRSLSHSPGHVFEEGEIDDAISFVTLAVLFLWDCYVVTPRRNKVLFFSHDEYGLTKGIDVGAVGGR
jgi:hypothetical protein